MRAGETVTFPAERTGSGASERRTALTLAQFAPLVAHETNQPIAAILLNCGAARNHLSGPNADLASVRDCIERIERDIRRAGAIIQRLPSLLADSPQAYSAVDFNLVVEQALDVLDHTLAQAGVVVIKALQPDLPRVSGDVVQLEQVLINLFTNAIEAMRSTASGARTLMVNTSFGDGQLVVTVRDTGPGVAPQAIERLFEPRFTTKSDGAGLGLCLARSIVEAHGGRLWATCGDPAGGCFSFTLRCAFEPAGAQAPNTNVTQLPVREVAAARRRPGARSAHAS